MKQKMQKFLKADIPFEKDDTTRFMPWVVALMVFLATLFLSLSLGVKGAINQWDQAVAATLTIQIPASEKADANVDKILKLLGDEPAVAVATPVPVEHTLSLLETWLGEGNVSPAMPIPRLIDVELVPDVEINLTGLSAIIEQTVPGAKMDDHKLWLADLVSFGQSIRKISFGILALVAGVAMAILIFATRSSMAIHHDTIELLHLIGARDNYIAKQFATQLLKLCLRGALLGMLLALAVIAVLYTASDALNDQIMPKFKIEPIDWALIAILPLLATLIGVGTGLFTVRRRLANIL